VKKVFYTDEIETHALSDVHLDVDAGEFISITGPSGCGKSTLLSIMGLLDVPTEGTYLLKGEDVSALDQAARAQIRNREIGFIFQAFNLIGDLNVYENVEVPLTYRGDMGRAERKQRVEEVLETVEMGHRARHFPSQLSGGQQQRVAIARALVGSASMLLVDEPTGNLDTKNAAIVMNLLVQLHEQGATICMVTHDPRSAEFADRGIALLDGQIMDDTTTTQAA
ncbi:MAG: ABC transporter ATP-binding protein, partial [Pseudomonadales bacterium]